MDLIKVLRKEESKLVTVFEVYPSEAAAIASFGK